MTESKAMILGCSGLKLTESEQAFYRAERPWGFILFARNISERNQVTDLICELRECVGRPDAPVLIDQEGGRVQRIKPPLVQDYPPAAKIGALHVKDRELGLRAAWIMARLHAFDLSRFGISVNCTPVLDVPDRDGHQAIGNRAYCNDPTAVAELGRQTMDGLMAGGVMPVIKHIPGHGRATVDSHFDLPVVNASLEELTACDFVPFRALRDAPMAMTAHIVYAMLDPTAPATSSALIIEQIIRQQIGFSGLLMSDDVSMKALSGDFATKAGAIFGAGCDVILHCNGEMSEMTAICGHTPFLTGVPADRADRVIKLTGRVDDADEHALRCEFAELLAEHVPLVG